MGLQPDNLETTRRKRRAQPPLWRRISYIRLIAVLFCLAVWVAVARACMRYF